MIVAAKSAIAAIAFVAGFSTSAYTWMKQREKLIDTHISIVAGYQEKYDRSVLEYNYMIDQMNRMYTISKQEYESEIERLSIAAARIPDTARVRVPAACPVPADQSGETGVAGGSGGTPGGVFLGGTGENYFELDVGPLKDLARKADETSAKLRDTIRRCRDALQG